MSALPSYDYRRDQAMLLIEQIEENGNAVPEQRSALALTAIAHLLVAGQPDPAPAPRAQTSTPVALLILTLLCATVLACVWLVTR